MPTSAAHAVPLLDRLRHLLCDVDAVPVEPLVAVVTAAERAGNKSPTRLDEYMCSLSRN